MKQNDQLFFGHRNIVLNGLLPEMRMTNTRGTFFKLIQHALTLCLTSYLNSTEASLVFGDETESNLTRPNLWK